MREKSEQIGGDHYSKRIIQPFDIIDEYKLNFYEANALKYLLRHREKNGKEDILKMIDYGKCIIDRDYPEADFSCLNENSILHEVANKCCFSYDFTLSQYRILREHFSSIQSVEILSQTAECYHNLNQSGFHEKIKEQTLPF